MLHYTPQHVSSSTLLILRRTKCITTASGIVTLCKQPYSMRVESGLQSALHLHTVRLLTEGDDTRSCGDTIGPPEQWRTQEFFSGVCVCVQQIQLRTEVREDGDLGAVAP